MFLKKFIVWSLDALCAVLHFTRFVPILRNFVGCQLAALSFKLEEKWETGCWKPIEKEY
jgi:hypothetical protein